MKLQTKLISSLEKVFPDKVNGVKLRNASVLQNEPFSFQVVFKNDISVKKNIPLYVEVKTDLDISLIAQYAVQYVPVTSADPPDSDNYFERKAAGLYPDMLLKRKTNACIRDDGQWWAPRWLEQDEEQLLDSVLDSYQTLWFTINEKGLEIDAGKYYINILFFDSSNKECVAEEKLNLTVIPAKLPKQTLYYTSWFHCDCLADTYGVEIFSDRFFEIMRSFVSLAAHHGMNMILLPAFTPPLDTTPGKERKTAQLVTVSCENGKYTFDFSLMKRYIDICRACGIKNFEHSHLFTQWGAKCAPKVMATVDGEYKRIFGWDTEATSEAYAAFLNSYFIALKEFLNDMRLNDHIMFHVSDEPSTNVMTSYENAQKIVEEGLKDFICADALSCYEFYSKGYTKRPIVVVNSPDMDKFSANCGNYWVYHTGAEITDGSSSCIIPATSARNRIIGLQMYVGGAKGFLHWGYNYYYGVLSHGLFNPAVNPCGYNQLAGTSYVVYPDMRGRAIPSLRMKVFYEGINDYRALQKLEELIGRRAVLEFVEKTIGKVTYTFCVSNKQLFDFRQKLNDEIKRHL